MQGKQLIVADWIGYEQGEAKERELTMQKLLECREFEATATFNFGGTGRSEGG